MGKRQETMVCVGVITGVHGVRGTVRIRSFTQDPEGVAAYGPVADAEGRRLELAVVGEAKGQVLARISGVDDRTHAERLKGRQLFVSRSSLPAPEEDEYYHADLVGLHAERSDGEAGATIGVVAAVHDFGAGPVIEVTRDGVPPVMVPFTADAVPTVDIAGGRIVISPLPGLFSNAGSDREVDGT